MKKLYVQISQQRFELESRGAEQDALVQETAKSLTAKIDRLRSEHGFPDSVRATALAALLIALQAENSDNTAEQIATDTILALGRQIDETLARTADSSARAISQ